MNIENIVFDTRQIFDAIQDSVAIIDKEHNVISINNAYLKILNKEEKEIVGKKCYDVLRGAFCHSENCPLDYIIKHQKVIEFETEKIISDGTKVPLILTATPFKSSSGELIGMIESFKDITDFKLSNKKLARIIDEVITALANTVESRDPYTFGHQEKVAKITEKITRKMGFSESSIKALCMAATIHDIGKIYVPSEFLTKPGKLSDIEFSVIKTHSDVGYHIIKDIEFEYAIAEIVRQHHERIDGSGYPRGLAGEEIMLEARILAVADSFEAMSSHRPYRPALGIGKAIEEIAINRGLIFDHKVVDAFLSLSKDEAFIEEATITEAQ